MLKFLNFLIIALALVAVSLSIYTGPKLFKKHRSIKTENALLDSTIFYLEKANEIHTKVYLPSSDPKVMIKSLDEIIIYIDKAEKFLTQACNINKDPRFLERRDELIEILHNKKAERKKIENATRSIL